MVNIVIYIYTHKYLRVCVVDMWELKVDLSKKIITY